MDDPAGPSSAAVALAAVAAALVVLVLGAHVSRAVAPRSWPGTPAQRVGATCLAAVGALCALALAVLRGASSRADGFGDPPYVAPEPFASLLIDVRLTTDVLPADRAAYATVVLVPLGLTALVLAAGLRRDPRSATVRLLAGALGGLLAAVAVVVARGEPGPLVGGVAPLLGALAFGVVAALVVDEVRGGRPTPAAGAPSDMSWRPTYGSFPAPPPAPPPPPSRPPPGGWPPPG